VVVKAVGDPRRVDVVTAAMRQLRSCKGRGKGGGSTTQAAISLFHKMKFRAGLHPDLKVYNAFLAVCASERRLATATAIFDDIKRDGLQPDLETYTVMTSLHAELGNTLEVESLRHEMKVARVVSDHSFETSLALATAPTTAETALVYSQFPNFLNSLIP
jgi:pentatricopeptide repeat protein